MEDTDAECDVCGADPRTGRHRESPLEELDPPEGFLDDKDYDEFIEDDEALHDEEVGGGASESTPESRWGCLLTVLFVLAVGALIAWLVAPKGGVFPSRVPGD